MNLVQVTGHHPPPLGLSGMFGKAFTTASEWRLPCGNQQHRNDLRNSSSASAGSAMISNRFQICSPGSFRASQSPTEVIYNACQFPCRYLHLFVPVKWNRVDGHDGSDLCARWIACGMDEVYVQDTKVYGTVVTTNIEFRVQKTSLRMCSLPGKRLYQPA